MTITVGELRKIVGGRFRRALIEALVELLPAVDKEEQRKIERVAGKPNDYRAEEFVALK